MNISFVSSEVVPFVKTGGLADVTGSLPNALVNLGHDVSVFMPYYATIMDTERYKAEIVKIDLFVIVGKKREGFAVRRYINTQGVKIYFIEHNRYFNRSYLYGDKNDAYYDNGERFVFFSQAVIIAMKFLEIKSDILHNNDWQTGLIPLYLKIYYSKDRLFKDTKKIFTIHNIEYQGIFNKKIMQIANIPWSEFSMHKLEFFDNINCLKAGIVYSDIITTVSKKYAQEISSNSWISSGLDSVLRLVNLRGILNGIDYFIWNPETDHRIIANYSVNDLNNKKKCQQYFFTSTGPVLAIVSRFVRAKGFDVVRETLEDILDSDEIINLLVLGTGASEYENFFKYLNMKYGNRVNINIKFDSKLAHRVYSAADIFLMPSQVEPCGLAQMISFRYGVVPVVNPVGGLFDTVKDYALGGNGFLMRDYSSMEFFLAVKKALKLYNNKKAWLELVKKNMRQDFSWKSSAKEYLDLYLNV
ncbi:MAG: glycogen synthase [bacterium]|nr:glycogen synthase [bacterium]